jgi:hypothetical protein
MHYPDQGYNSAWNAEKPPMNVSNYHLLLSYKIPIETHLYIVQKYIQ